MYFPSLFRFTGIFLLFTHFLALSLWAWPWSKDAQTRPASAIKPATYDHYTGPLVDLVPECSIPLKQTLHRTYDESEEVFWEGEFSQYQPTRKSARVCIYVYKFFPNTKYGNTPEIMTRGWEQACFSAFQKAFSYYDDSHAVGRGDLANKEYYSVKCIDEKWPTEITRDYTHAYDLKPDFSERVRKLLDNYHYTEYEAKCLKSSNENSSYFSVQAGNIEIFGMSKGFDMSPPKMRPVIEKMLTKLPRHSNPLPSFELIFTPGQVLDISHCRAWIQDKPAVLRVKLKWSEPKIQDVQAKVEFFCNGQQLHGISGGMNLPADGIFTFKSFFSKQDSASKHRLSQDTANLIFIPSTSGKNLLEVVVTPTALDGKPLQTQTPLKTSAEVHVVKISKTIHFRFMPIAVGDWTNQGQMNLKAYTDFLKEQIEFFSSVFPLPPNQIHSDGSPSMLKPENTFGEKISGQTRLGLLARLQSLHQSGQVDIAIGMLPEKWLGDIGITEPSRFPNALLLGVGQSYEPALAHEYMHLLGFSHYSKKTMSSIESSGVSIISPTRFYRKDCIWGTDSNSSLTEVMSEDLGHADSVWIHKEHYLELLKLVGKP